MNSFPRNTTIQLTANQASLAFELRKSFPGFAKNAKGTEKGGIYIYLDEQSNTIKISSTKQSFINVVVYSITQWYKDNSKPKSNKKDPPQTKKISTNSFQLLEEKEPDTHLTIFGCRLPMDHKKGVTWKVGHTSFEDTSTNNEPAVKKILAFSKTNKDFPSLGTPIVTNHKWNGSQKVSQGSGLINPPKPKGWFGINEINDHLQTVSNNKRLQKIDDSITHRRQQKDATDEMGNIVDLEEYIQAQKDDEEEAEINDDLSDDSWGDDDDIKMFYQDYQDDWDME